MIKLSDAVLADIKANACNGGMSTEDGIRAFYDVQIDAQAKTMEQIALSDLRDYVIDMENVRQFMADYKLDFDRDMMNIFEAKLAGFLAAGGTIKEPKKCQ